MTQVQLAARCGLGQSYIAAIERGEINPTAKTIRRLAAGMGIEPGRVLTAIGEIEITRRGQ
jgi:transcriptional regulator with XRE-family HTH domain